jgi:diaminopropionate ammonia-lyase
MSVVSSRFLGNAVARRGEYPNELREIMNATKAAEAAWEISSWSGYRPSELHQLSALASELGIGSLWYKDESSRFGLGSFKALGGAYAIYRILSKLVQQNDAPDLCAAAARMTFACATAGNHGISVAWAARRWGAKCVVYVPDTVPAQRINLIRSLGADLRVVGSFYDESVDQLAAHAEKNGWCVVSDTAYPGYVDIPADVMNGYTVIAQEILDQLPPGEQLTHAFLQCGVGGLSCAIIAHLWERLGSNRPINIIVEPDSAACFFQSLQEGAVTALHAEMNTQLVCLACARLSILAWPVLRSGVDFALTISDDAAFRAVRELAQSSRGAIACGECGAAGLGGLLTALAQPQLAERMRLGPDSKVLVIGSEGPLNQRLYKQITGKDSSVSAFDEEVV